MAAPPIPGTELPAGSPPWSALVHTRTWEDRLPRLRERVAAHLQAGGPRLSAALRPLQRPSAAFVAAVEQGGTGAGAAQLAGSLAGLGVGATPAGDDFLIGAFHALWATGQGERTAALSAAAIPRTTTVSAYWLDTASRGFAAPAWRGLLDTLAAPDVEATTAAASRVLACGHTSGVASLLGFLALAEAAERKR